ncbi:hypothetical protein [Thauera linaloolentis]|uniref:hypothetical protein n=1 Tax=Thauera linaloolentis TaxID=76112 RepID=UPI0012B61D3A|nr:hypothetical protein [Thauera linaloolentis]MCM8567721.1 hypothetical protein [Thauera linaloolentis]
MRFHLLPLTTSLLFTSQVSHANEALDFVLQKAKDHGFTACNAAIRNAFSVVGGSGIRVITDKLPQTRDDSLKITAAFGEAGDSVYVSAEFRKIGKECIYTRTIILPMAKSCTAYFAEMSDSFKLEAETAGTIFTKNSGGANMLLIPAGSNCVAIFNSDGVKPATK